VNKCNERICVDEGKVQQLMAELEATQKQLQLKSNQFETLQVFASMSWCLLINNVYILLDCLQVLLTF